MACYVDYALVRGRWCHLGADTLEELHALARLVGLKRAWFHRGARVPHYDVTVEQRVALLSAGAVAVTARELVARYAQAMKPVT